MAGTGPWYFAYVNQGTAFNAAVHNVEDEEIYTIDLDHSEGDFCAIELTLKNPRVGLLAAGRLHGRYYRLMSIGRIRRILFRYSTAA